MDGDKKGCKHCNEKTCLSFDTTTVCPKNRAGRPCAYCYVETARKVGYRAKDIIMDDKYDGWVMRLTQATLSKLKHCGGLRMFAFADFIPRHKKEIVKFLEDCQDRMIDVKVITKISKFVRDFHDYPAIKVINLSVDSLPKEYNRSPVRLSTAKSFRERYYKVAIRAVILSYEDIPLFGDDPEVDVLTFNHGANGFTQFPKQLLKEYSKKYPLRVCCENSVCVGCKTLCGIPAVNAKKKEWIAENTGG